MISFTSWLAEAFRGGSTTDLFYTERLWAFNKLNKSTAAFIASQKEHYKNLNKILQLWMRNAYDFNLPIQSYLPVKVRGYSGAIQDVTLHFVNGISFPSSDLHQGVHLYRLADLPPLQQKEVLTTCMADIGSTDDLFVLLNRMLAQESYVLEITADERKVINIQHIITDSAFHIVPHLILKIGQASQVTLIESWYTCQCKLYPFVNNLTHVLLEKKASLSYHTLHIDDPSCYQVNNFYCNQKDHSTFSHYTFSFGAAMLRMHLRAQVNGSYAHANLYGLSILGATENVDHQIQVTHTVPYSISQQYYKSILSGKSTGHFSGKIHLMPAAQQTNAYQTNNALILSDGARYYMKPQLEIFADDVKCSHGATTGQLDDIQIFYLQTRGIAPPLAKKILLEAFCKEMIEVVSLPKLQDYLYDKLVAKLVKL